MRPLPALAVLASVLVHLTSATVIFPASIEDVVKHVKVQKVALVSDDLGLVRARITYRKRECLTKTGNGLIPMIVFCFARNPNERNVMRCGPFSYLNDLQFIRDNTEEHGFVRIGGIPNQEFWAHDKNNTEIGFYTFHFSTRTGNIYPLGCSKYLYDPRYQVAPYSVNVTIRGNNYKLLHFGLYKESATCSAFIEFLQEGALQPDFDGVAVTESLMDVYRSGNTNPSVSQENAEQTETTEDLNVNSAPDVHSGSSLAWMIYSIIVSIVLGLVIGANVFLWLKERKGLKQFNAVNAPSSPQETTSTVTADVVTEQDAVSKKETNRTEKNKQPQSNSNTEII